MLGSVVGGRLGDLLVQLGREILGTLARWLSLEEVWGFFGILVEILGHYSGLLEGGV